MAWPERIGDDVNDDTITAGAFLAERGTAPHHGAIEPWLQGARYYRDGHYAAAEALVSTAGREQRDLRASEQRAFEVHTNETKEFAGLIGAAEREERTMNELRAHSPVYGAAARAPSGDVRAFLSGESRSVDVPIEYRALSKLTAGAGGNTVPTSFANVFVEHLVNNAAVLGVATVLNTSGGEPLQLPTTNAYSTAALTAEAAVIAASDPTFTQVTLGAYKYANLIQVSTELLSDSGVDMESYLARQAGEAVGNAAGIHFATGTGVAQPSGVVTGATTGVTGATGVAGAFTADNLIDLHFSVIPPYRRNGTWMMNDATLATVRKLKDTTGQYLFQPSLVAGTPDMLMGRPVITDPNVAGVALSAKSVLFGDFSRYYVRVAGGLRFERSDDFAFSSDLVTFRCIWRGDGILADTHGAVKYFAGAAT